MTSSQLSEANMPTVYQPWIYSMVILGFIGFVFLTLLTIIAVYKTFKSKTKNKSKLLAILPLTLFLLNTLSCLEWAFFRTDLFINLNPFRCTIIYISNYLFYMFAKYCLHILLIFRLWIVFRGTPLHLNTLFVNIFASIITIDFFTFVSIWLNICLEKVNVGIIVPSKSLYFCTLYNNSTADELTTFQKIWPSLLGGQDFIVGTLTLYMFVYKLKQLSKHRTTHDPLTEALVRKLFLMGVISIVSTNVLFTFAIPLYSNLTFLLPLDATINSICVAFMLDWTSKIYGKLCCGFDTVLQAVFKHEKSTTKSNGKKFILDGINLSTVQSEGTTKSVPTNKSNASNLASYLHTPHSDHDEKVPSFGTDSNKVNVITDLNNLNKEAAPAPDSDINIIYRDFRSASAVMDHRTNNKHGKSESHGLNGQTRRKKLDPLHLADSRFVKSSPLL